MTAGYFLADDDTTTKIDVPLEVEDYGCGVTEMNGKVIGQEKELLHLCLYICEESSVGGIKCQSTVYQRKSRW